MKNKDLAVLMQALSSLTGIKGKEFAYAVFKNKTLIEDELKIFDQLKREPHEDYPNYENERNIVCMNYAQKDDKGNAVVQGPDNNKHYVIEPSSKEEFQNEMNEVQDKYSEVIKDIEEAKNEINEFMEKESSVDLVKITFKDLPDDIDANFIEAIKAMLD